MGKINIAFITDQNYLDYFLVAVNSLLEHTKSDLVVRAIITFPINESIKEKEKKISEKYENVSFSFVFFDENNHLKEINSKNHVSKAAYAKIFLPNILNDTDKVIFLDSDLLILDDIKKLWQHFDNNEFTIGAVWDPAYNQDNKLLKLETHDKTFNSGVMLMNLNNMRINNDMTKLKEFIDEKNHLSYLNDQAAFNYIYAKMWFELPLRWNIQYRFYFSNNRYLNISKKGYSELMNEPGIVHFTSKSKPWQRRNAHPYKKRFLSYYSGEESKKSYFTDNIQYIHESVTIHTKIDLIGYLKNKLKLRNLKKSWLFKKIQKK